jgi:hypothetical protein
VARWESVVDWIANSGEKRRLDCTMTLVDQRRDAHVHRCAGS